MIITYLKDFLHSFLFYSTIWCLLNKSSTDCTSYCMYYILRHGRIMVSKEVQITNMETNKQKLVSTNYSGSYFSHPASHPTGLLHGLTGYPTGTKQRMQWNPKVRQCVKHSPWKAAWHGSDKVDKVVTWDCTYNRISSLGCVHTADIQANERTNYND